MTNIFSDSSPLLFINIDIFQQTSPAPEAAPGPRLQKGPGNKQQRKKKGGRNKF